MSDVSVSRSPLYDAVPTIYAHHDQLWAGTPAHFLEALYTTFDYRADDVWLSSYPRSGTAWTYEVLYAVLYEGDIAALQQAQQAGHIRPFGSLEVNSVASVVERLNAWKARPSPRIIPTHVPYRLYPPEVFERRVKRVYVLRNPKDVAVSFYHFHRTLDLLGPYQGTWDAFLECFLNGQIIYGSWFDHTLGWWGSLHEQPDTVLILHYEAMQQDLAAHVRRLGAFLDKDLSSRAVEAIAAHCAFESMQANAFTNPGLTEPEGSLRRFRRLRKGMVGDWQMHFTDDQNRRFKAVWDQKMGDTTLWHYYMQ